MFHQNVSCAETQNSLTDFSLLPLEGGVCFSLLFVKLPAILVLSPNIKCRVHVLKKNQSIKSQKENMTEKMKLIVERSKPALRKLEKYFLNSKLKLNNRLVFAYSFA